MEFNSDLKKGQVVKSISGRDKGKVFLIFEIVDDDMVTIVNGKLRGVEKPKLKKVKHLMVHNEVINGFYDDKLPVSMNNSKIRDLLKSYEAK